MDIRKDVSLKDHSAMKLGGTAAYAVDIHSRSELSEAIAWANEHSLPILMIGSGSNIVWKDEGFLGLLIVNKVMGYEGFAEDEQNYYLTIGAGEIWDSVVERSVKEGASGIEALSLIPGTVGATPVQNVGAYGQEISQTLVSIEAYDNQAKQFITIPNSDCQFGYRTSRFKTTDRGQFFIIAITLHLMKTNPTPPFYPALNGYLSEHGITTYTPQTIRDAVIAIRRQRLPDPASVANNGSFFANPMIDQGAFAQILADHPDVMYWRDENNMVKLAAAWLVEQAGFKDFHDPETGMATWPKQSLVLVNEHAKTTADLLKFKDQIVSAVHKKFNITLVQEPELLP